LFEPTQPFAVRIDNNTRDAMERPNACQEEKTTCHEQLTGQILEHVLLFLPEKYVVTLSLTCKYWKSELEGGSAGYWQQALKRRNLPFAHYMKSADCHYMRQTFIEHYKAIGCANIIQQAYNKLHLGVMMAENGTSRDSSVATIYQDRSPIVWFHCWSENEVVMVRGQGRALDLYQFNRASDSVSTEKSLIASSKVQRSSEYHGWHSGPCATALDEVYLARLCHIYTKEIGFSSPWLHFMKREDFTRRDERGDNVSVGEDNNQVWTSLDVRQAILDYIAVNEDCQAVSGIIQGYSELGGEINDVVVGLSDVLCACGNGLFLSIAYICIRSIKRMSEGEMYHKVHTKMVMLYASTNSIEWVGDFDPIAYCTLYGLESAIMTAKRVGGRTIVTALCTSL
jgi:F-box domain